MKVKFTTLIATGITLALASNFVAVAESSEKSTRKLSPDVMKILCERFPQNSRCEQKSTTETPEEIIPSETTPETTETETETNIPATTPEGVMVPTPEENSTPATPEIPTTLPSMPESDDIQKSPTPGTLPTPTEEQMNTPKVPAPETTEEAPSK